MRSPRNRLSFQLGLEVMAGWQSKSWEGVRDAAGGTEPLWAVSQCGPCAGHWSGSPQHVRKGKGCLQMSFALGDESIALMWRFAH